MSLERPRDVRRRGSGPERLPEVEGGAVVDVEQRPERELVERCSRAGRKHDLQGKAQIACGPRSGDREVVDLPRDPERLEVGDGAARGQVPPGSARVVADHSLELRGHFQLEPGGDRRRLGRHVVGIVEHGREVADLRRDGLLEDHVSLVAPAEERHVALERRRAAPATPGSAWRRPLRSPRGACRPRGSRPRPPDGSCAARRRDRAGPR